MSNIYLHLLLIFSLVFSTQTTAQDCGDVCNQNLEITAAGGSKPYTYLWSDGQTSAIATELCRGIAYTCVVTDADGHIIPGSNYMIRNEGGSFLFGNSYTIPGTAPLTLEVSTTETTEACFGTATATPQNGSAPYHYEWSADGQTTATATGLCAGEYRVTITDANSCSLVSTVQIVQELGPLPVKLVSFSAKKQNQQVILDWSTSEELNNQGFDIERSIDGLNWNKLSFVKSETTVTNANQYNYRDRSPHTGINYYRLKQINLHGDFEYSTIVSIQITQTQEIAVFPNPTKGMLQIKDFDFQSLRVFDKNGRLVMEQSNFTTKLDMSNFSTGVYFIQVISDSDAATYRVIKE